MKDIGDLWRRQDEQTREFDFHLYATIPWMFVKTLFSLAMLTLVYLLYALHELPWSLFGSAVGLLILSGMPFFAGVIMGYSFEKPKFALAYSMIVGFASIALTFILFKLPATMGLAGYGPGFMVDVWFYGFFIPFIITISFVPAGAMLAASTNVFE